MAGKKTANRRKKTRSLKGKTKSWGSRLSSLAKGFRPGGANVNKHRSRGGGNPYGTNNVGMTISAAKKLYANQLAEGISLQDAMRRNKAETVSFHDLLDEKNDTKQSNSNKTMASNKDWLTQTFNQELGRDPSYGSTGGADYWLDQMDKNPTSHSRDEVLRMIKGSDEGKKYRGEVSGWDRKGQASPGGIDPNKSLYDQFGTGNTWLEHFAPGGVLAPNNVDDTFSAVQSSLGQINPTQEYKSFGDNTFNPPTVPLPYVPPTPPVPESGWWSEFENADAFKKFLQGDQTSGGMDDFMKFMMLMSVMGGGRGGGIGGGSQYGYGGLNPGGVQSAYDPISQLQGMGSWFKDNFGSGSSTSTGNINAT